MVWITTGKSLYVTQKQMTHKHVWHETVIHMWQTTAHDTQAFLTWNSCPCVANNRKWHTIMFGMKQLSTCGKQQQMTHKHFCLEAVVHMWQTTANDIPACWTWNSYPYVANNSKWHTIIFDMKHLSICDKQQQMTYKHFRHETVIHLWQTTANDTEAFLTWNSCPYVANNSKWHTSMFDMKQLSICGKQQQMTQAFLTWKSYPYVATTAKDIQSCLTWNSYPYVANNSKWHTNMFAMKQLSICGKQQQMTHNIFDMKQLSICGKQQQMTWNSYPYVANNSKWHTSIFDMKQLSICGKQQQMTHKHVWHETVIHMWQTTANEHFWQLSICGKQQQMTYKHFDMKQLSICGKQQQMTHKNFWHETVIHVLFIYLFKIYFTFLISQAVKLTIYTGRKTKIFTYNIRK